MIFGLVMFDDIFVAVVGCSTPHNCGGNGTLFFLLVVKHFTIWLDHF
jgi:hypothetical protein